MFQLYVVTGSGYYPLIQGSIPTNDIKILKEIKILVDKIRPGNGRVSETVILECEKSGLPTEESRKKIDWISSEIFRRINDEHASYYRL